MNPPAGFTVKVEPRKRRLSRRTVYDIHVIDGAGSDGEDRLLYSVQGYENRAFAERLAVRLFGNPKIIAVLYGIDPPELREAERAVLLVYSADGNLDHSTELRPLAVQQ